MSGNQKKKISFSSPWGDGGVIWRTGVFLLGMVLLCLLALLPRECTGGGSKDSGKERLTPGSNPWQDEHQPFRKDFTPLDDDLRDDLFKDNRSGEDDPSKDPDDLFKDAPIDRDSLLRLFKEFERQLPPDLRLDEPVEDWNRPIEGVPELPDKDDNYIPPIDSTRIVPNPKNPYENMVCDQLVVFFNSTDLEKDMADFARQFKALYPGSDYAVSYYNRDAGTMVLKVPEDRLLAVKDELPQKITGIKFRVTTNYVMSGWAASAPSDPGFRKASYDAYFKLIQAYDAWEVTRGDPNVKVAIVDSYFDLTNPEIGQRYVDPINILTKTKNVLPPHIVPGKVGGLPGLISDLGTLCHGSHVAGLAIGGQGNGLGCSGIAPECSWIPIAVGNQMSAFNVIEGILYAIYHGADVVNLSIGLFFKSPEHPDYPLGDQITIAREGFLESADLWEYVSQVAADHKCVLVTAAGNEHLLMGMDPKTRPSGFIKVEAVDAKGMAADFTNFGKVPEANMDFSTVSAPGVDLWSVSDKRYLSYWENLPPECGGPFVVDHEQGFQEMGGTSMASPVVAGAVALLKSKNKDLTNEQVANILVMTARQIDTKNRIGPTIQLRDALDATGGELVKMNDLLKDHSQLIGKWRSQHEMVIRDLSTGDLIDTDWMYFIFDSETSGRLEYHAINLKRVYTAPLQVSWRSDGFDITQLRNAEAPDGNTVNKDAFRCHPDEKGLLATDCYKINGDFKYSCLLERVY